MVVTVHIIPNRMLMLIYSKDLRKKVSNPPIPADVLIETAEDKVLLLSEIDNFSALGL